MGFIGAMRVEQRVCRGKADIEAMIALARLSPKENLHVADLPYRLSSWALDFPDNTRVWIDAECRLLAWAVLQTPFWTIDYALHPEADGRLHGEILTWADRRARQIVAAPKGHSCWFVNVLAGLTDRTRYLEAAGFVCQAHVEKNPWSKVLLCRPAQKAIPNSVLPSSIFIRPLAGENEVEAYTELHRTVFQSKNMTAEWRTRILHCPEYLPELDLVAVAAGGSLIAFCICWLGKDSQEEVVGQIEPLGVHPAFHQLGLGRAILSEALRRMRHFGVNRIYLQTDTYRNAALQLYKAMGFCFYQDVLVYRKDYLA